MVEKLDPTATSEDGAVVLALRSGDESAFVELVQRYHRPLLRLAQAYVPSQSVAEEVVQDTWIAVIKGIDGFEGRSTLRTWIFRILTYQAKSRGERERRSIPMSAFDPLEPGSDTPSVDPSRFRPPNDPRWAGHWAEPPADWGSDAEQRLLGRETQGVISSAMEALPPTQRMVMTLRDLEGWDSEEVCAALDITAGNQRVLLHRARSKVRASLERYFLEGTRV